VWGTPCSKAEVVPYDVKGLLGLWTAGSEARDFYRELLQYEDVVRWLLSRIFTRVCM
jgi:hypothetical protein